ncbi:MULTISPECIES: hypothetical protein [unclassified Carboxylicivirga]|uniref:hypothetical protein n=1 Tax=Carboxylicivirga TaxID=1628153 RepID=UPI003D32715B
MCKYRNILIIIALALIAVNVAFIDYGDLSWSVNKGSYLGIVSMVLLIISMVLSNRHEERHKDQK